ncbi:MAG: sulfotransferase [Minwuia sp.]|nr:sulfotransferase [Minwuia sp.]
MTAETPRKGVIVLGHPRSGTTLLRRLLDAHPALAAPPETHLFSAAARFIKADMTAHGVDMGVLAGLEFAGFSDEIVLDRLRSLVFSFLDDYARAQGKQRWVEKTAFDIHHVDAIQRICGERVHYLGVIRHPLDVAVSCKDFCDAAGTYPEGLYQYIQKYPQPIEAFVNSWIDTTRSLMQLGEKFPETCMICRYEDLVVDVEGVLGELLSFIGEEPGPTLGQLGGTDVLGFSDHRAYETDQVVDDRVSKWQGLPGAQIARLAPQLNPLLEACGYEQLDGDMQVDASAARRSYVLGQAAGLSRGRNGV